jgi:class 3 adenylate cyclase
LLRSEGRILELLQSNSGFVEPKTCQTASLGTIGFEGRFDYAAIGTVSNVASRLCDEAKPGQILISPRVLTKVENAVRVEPVGEFELKGIRRPLAAYNVVAAAS